MPLEYIQWKEAVAGAVSGALTVLALHPLDVIKTRLQVQEAKPDRGLASRYKGAVHAFRVIQRREGIRGLYSGLSPSLIGNAVSWGLYWVAWKSLHGYQVAQQHGEELSWGMKLLCGMQAGVLVTLVTNPIWVVKTRMQLESTNVTRAAARAAVTHTKRPTSLTFPGAVRSIYARDGIVGFYRGIGPALLLCSHGAIQIMAYEELKSLWKQGIKRYPGLTYAVPDTSEAFVTGAAAKLVASAFTYPLQVARSRMQQRLDGQKILKYGTMPRAFVTILQQGGVRALYQGFAANAARVCPNAALQFFLYEQAKKFLGGP